MFEIDYISQLRELKTRFPGQLYGYNKNHLIFRNSEVVGDSNSLIELAAKQFGFEDADVFNSIVYNRFVRDNLYKMVTDQPHSFVFIEFADSGPKSVKDASLPTLPPLIIELYVLS
jgi:hypothetical protein